MKILKALWEEILEFLVTLLFDIDFNINNITDRQAKVMIKIFSKMLFEYNARLEDRASYPVHIFIEEAHRYMYALHQ